MPNITGLRERRQRTGVKSGEFAAMCSYSRNGIVSVENGNRPASPEAIHRIASVLTELGVPTNADDLIVGDEKPAQPKREPSRPPNRPHEGETKGPNDRPSRRRKNKDSDDVAAVAS